MGDLQKSLYFVSSIIMRGIALFLFNSYCESGVLQWYISYFGNFLLPCCVVRNNQRVCISHFIHL